MILLCAQMDRRKTNRFFKGAQIFGAAAMSFMHGAQDGQKFIGVLFLGLAFTNGQNSVQGMVIPVWLMILCSFVMGTGTSVGGEKIIKSVGMDMVKLEKFQGFFRRPGGSSLPAVFQRVRNSRIHDAYQDQRDHGRRRGQENFRDQFRRGEGHDAHLDLYLSRVRPDQLRHGEDLYGTVLELRSA